MSSLLDQLPPEEQRAVRAAARRRTFSRNEVVFHQGDPGDTLHLIDKGTFAVRVLAPSGDELTVNVLAPPDSFGELAILDPDARRTATISALDAGVTQSLGAAQLAELRREHAGVDRWLMALLAGYVKRLTNDLVDAHFTPVDRRLLQQLGRLMDIYSPGGDPSGGETVEIPVTQDVLAAMAGTTRPSANHLLGALAEEGVVQLSRGRITVLDVSAIASRAAN